MDLMSEHLNNGVILPERFEIPEELVFRFMIWSLAKYYGMPPVKAGTMKEIDFWQMIGFENLEQAKNEYLLKLRSGN
jgi:hypothetical protein